jgi:hypothetical protein
MESLATGIFLCPSEALAEEGLNKLMNRGGIAVRENSPFEKAGFCGFRGVM